MPISALRGGAARRPRVRRSAPRGGRRGDPDRRRARRARAAARRLGRADAAAAGARRRRAGADAVGAHRGGARGPLAAGDPRWLDDRRPPRRRRRRAARADAGVHRRPRDRARPGRAGGDRRAARLRRRPELEARPRAAASPTRSPRRATRCPTSRPAFEPLPTDAGRSAPRRSPCATRSSTRSTRAATHAFSASFLIAAAFALAALIPIALAAGARGRWSCDDRVRAAALLVAGAVRRVDRPGRRLSGRRRRRATSRRRSPTRARRARGPRRTSLEEDAQQFLLSGARRRRVRARRQPRGARAARWRPRSRARSSPRSTESTTPSWRPRSGPGIVRAIDDAEDAGADQPAGRQRPARRSPASLPVDQAIDLINGTGRLRRRSVCSTQRPASLAVWQPVGRRSGLSGPRDYSGRPRWRARPQRTAAGTAAAPRAASGGCWSAGDAARGDVGRGDRHVDVGREDRGQQRRAATSGQAAGGAGSATPAPPASSATPLQRTASSARERHVVGHDRLVLARADEVHRPGEEPEDAERRCGRAHRRGSLPVGDCVGGGPAGELLAGREDDRRGRSPAVATDATAVDPPATRRLPAVSAVEAVRRGSRAPRPSNSLASGPVSQRHARRGQVRRGTGRRSRRAAHRARQSS